MGDAAGIGPEVIGKALASESLYEICRPVVIGDLSAMRDTLPEIKSSAKLHAISSPEEAAGQAGTIDLLDMHNLGSEKVAVGKLSAICGKASVEYILKAADLALQKQVSAIVTAPINKESTRMAGCGELGHMELLAKYTKVKENATMLTSGALRVVHLTTHHSLKEALNYVTRERILSQIKLTQVSFESWGMLKPRIAAAALNPHGGEGGILGAEEIQEIAPAVKDAQQLGIDARGPYPADTVFNRAIGGEFDVVLAMYHDQGHIPIKVYGFEKSVSVALGLPFIRTSVDHGTAYDIAGKGIANEESMIEAIKVAVNLVREKRL
jgi:4-hydroxythreonine-4-phosphate dehydrogenase